MALLTAQNLSYIYGEGTPYEKHAVTDVSFSVEAGEIVGVIGHTGSGKSTLVQMLNGLLKPCSGTVLLDGVDILADPKTMRSTRFQVGLVFQYPEYQLFDETVEKDIAFGPRNMGLDPREVARRATRAAELVGLPAQLLDKSPFDLSGGEKRRAAIAGVMAMEPRVLILDEPTAGLDPKGRQTILERIHAYNQTTGAAVLFVSHNMEDVAALCHKVLVLSKGRLQLFGTTAQVFSQGETLASLSLGVPAVTRILAGLAARGFAVTPGLYTLDDAAAELLRLKKAGDSRA